jgi:LysR family transcriptional regulator, benzoate and cis,cis-muconate-responsive activator of ben and cat genes
MRYLPELEAIQSFLLVAEEGSFRKAAERLGIDQSALSRRIKDLEGRLGFELLHRTTREVRPTEAGLAFFADNRALRDALEAAVERARGVAEGRHGRLRIGYMEFAALGPLPRAVRAFAGAYPDVAVELVYLRTQAQKLALSNGEIEVANLIGPFEHSDVETLALSREPIVALAAADGPLAGSERVTFDDLSRVGLVMGSLREWDFYRWTLEDHFSAGGTPFRVTFEASSAVGVIGLVTAGLGVALLPLGFARQGWPGTVVRRLEPPEPELTTLTAWRKGAGPQVARFAAELEAAARASTNL